MTANQVLDELKSYGDEQTKKILMKHGAKEPFFGVKVADLKKILKKTKKNHELSLDLFNTGNSDAMYLAGLMADEKQISREQLNDWVKKAYWFYLNEFAVPSVAAETSFGFELGLEWIESEDEKIASAGWSTLSFYAGLHLDSDLDITVYSKLLDRISLEIHKSQNRVRHTMNGFVIAIGIHIKDLTDKARDVANKVGKVSVDMNGTACKVPFATDYINKSIANGQIGRKRKSSRC
jgi:3-methyladenine DNA glycosylase AlkD